MQTNKIIQTVRDLLYDAHEQFACIDGTRGCEKAQGRYEGLANAFSDYKRSGTIRDIAWMRDACDSYYCKQYSREVRTLLETLNILCSLIEETGIKVEQIGHMTDVKWENAIQLRF